MASALHLPPPWVSTLFPVTAHPPVADSWGHLSCDSGPSAMVDSRSLQWEAIAPGVTLCNEPASFSISNSAPHPVLLWAGGRGLGAEVEAGVGSRGWGQGSGRDAGSRAWSEGPGLREGGWSHGDSLFPARRDGPSTPQGAQLPQTPAPTTPLCFHLLPHLLVPRDRDPPPSSKTWRL